MLVYRLYIATGTNALRRGASRKLSIKTLRSAISLHPHYSIVTIARLRQLFSGRFRRDCMTYRRCCSRN